jgi:hypothetical protein
MAAKALVVTVTSAALSLVTLPISWVIVLPRLNSLGLDTPAGNVLGALGRNVGYLTLLALFAFAFTVTVWWAIPSLLGGAALVRKDA